MCGFIVRWTPGHDSVPLVEATDLAHRGPDGDGAWAGRRVSMAHRRLAVYDPARGAQPFAYLGIRLVYNGALYNRDALRRALMREGCVFATRCDTEVVAAALWRWGHAGVGRFRGVYALAWFDVESGALGVARDRFGVRPLYLATPGGNTGDVWLASEAGALARAVGPVQLDTTALAEYLAVQNHWTGATLFQGVVEVPAGTVAVYRPTPGEAFTVERTVLPWCSEEPHYSPSAPEARLRDALLGAVEAQADVDVPVGAYLSGGVDSGLLVGMASSMGFRLSTFTVGWDEQGVPGARDEREAARRVARLYGTDHHEVEVGPARMEAEIPRLCEALDHPRVGQSHPDWIAAGLAQGKVKVVLSGAGADELFGGYAWRRDIYTNGVTAALGWWTQRMGGLGLVKGHPATAVVPRLEAAMGPKVGDDGGRRFEAGTFLAGLLTVVDRCAMHHGLEARVPFLDPDVVEAAMALPVRHPDRQDKRALRALAEFYIGAAAWAPKQGFSAPDGEWFRGRSQAFVEGILGPDARLWEVVDRKQALMRLNEHFIGARNNRLLVWGLMQVEFWLRRWS